MVNKSFWKKVNKNATIVLLNDISGVVHAKPIVYTYLQNGFAVIDNNFIDNFCKEKKDLALFLDIILGTLVVQKYKLVIDTGVIIDINLLNTIKNAPMGVSIITHTIQAGSKENNFKLIHRIEK